MSDTWTISPRTVNQAWISYTRQFGGRIPVPDTDTWATFGSDFGISGPPSRGQIPQCPDWFGLTQAITGPKAGTNQYAVRDVLNTTRGKHTLYLGGEGGLEKDFQQTSLEQLRRLRLRPPPLVPAPITLCRTSLPGYPNSFEQDTGEYAECQLLQLRLLRPGRLANSYVTSPSTWASATIGSGAHRPPESRDQLHSRRAIPRVHHPSTSRAKPATSWLPLGCSSPATLEFQRAEPSPRPITSHPASDSPMILSPTGRQ